MPRRLPVPTPLGARSSPHGRRFHVHRMETSPCPELSHPCLLHAVVGCCQPSQHLCCAVCWHRPITVLPTALAYKEWRVCHLSTPIVGRVSSTVSRCRSPLFSSPWLTDDSSPHHCFFLMSRFGREPSSRCNSPIHRRRPSLTEELPHRHHAAAKTQSH
jgi:hypothetical protein